MFLVLCYHSCHNKNKTGVYVLLKKKDVGCHQPVFVFVFLFLHSLFFSITAMQGTNKNSKSILYILYCVSFHNYCYEGAISFIKKRAKVSKIILF